MASDENAKDDEITIDFSDMKKKIGSLFSKKAKTSKNNSKDDLEREEEVSEHEAETSEYDEETSGKASANKGVGEPDANQEDVEDQIPEKDDENVSGDSEDSSDSSEKDDVSISFDMDKAASFFKKYWHYVALILVIIFVVYMRAQASYAPVTDMWARNTINNYFTNQVRAEIESSQNPNLPEANKQLLIQERLKQILEEQKDFINVQVKELSKQYKDAISYEYNGKKYVYLGDIDSYYWLRFSKNVVDKGMICDEINNGNCWDNLALAPLGRNEVPNIHPYMIAYAYKGSKLIGKDIPLMQAALITPTIIAVFVAIAAFFVGFALTGKLGGIFTSILISCNSMYVQRSLGSDNDIYNLLFPLIILAFFFLAIQAKSRKKMIIFAFLAGLFVGLFKFAWESGWWNIFDTILYSFVLYIGFLFVYNTYKHKNFSSLFKSKLFKNSLLLLALFYIGGFIGFYFVGSMTGASINEYIQAPLGPVDFIKFSKSAVNLNIWPNVKTTVAEFNAIPLSRVPSQLFIGSLSKVLFFLGLFGIFLFFMNQIITKKNKWLLLSASVIMAIFFSSDYALTEISNIAYFVLLGIASFSYLLYILYLKIDIDIEKQHHIFTGIILVVWLLGTLYAATKGVRFTMLVVPSIAIALGCGLEIIYKRIVILFDSSVGYRTLMVIKVITLLILFYFPLSVASSSLEVSRSFVPNYNAAWDASLSKIREESAPDAIVNSWWDFGHWFKYTTERSVTLDGATQNSPALHWLGKLLLTDDEQLSRGILRMIDCGSNLAFDAVFNATGDSPVSVDILNEIIVLDDEQEIKTILAGYNISEQDQDNILQYSHCDPPENYLITSDDMVGKSPVWAHFGSWDFYKAEMATLKLTGKGKSEIISNITSKVYRDTSEQDAEKLYSELIRYRDQDQINAWIAPWPSYAGIVVCRPKDDSVYVCDNGVNFDSLAKECYINTPEGRKYPKNCAFVDGEDVTLKEYNESIFVIEGRVLGAAFFPSGNNMNLLLMDPDLTGSMFTRLFYMNGHGLKYFDLFTLQPDGVTPNVGTQIAVWKVDWDGTSKNEVYKVSKPAIVADEVVSVDESAQSTPSDNTAPSVDDEEMPLVDEVDNTSSAGNITSVDADNITPTTE